MISEEDETFMNIGGGCPVHGDDFMAECTVCGSEFCTRCNPRSALCPDCAELPEDELELEPAEEPAEDKDPEDDEAERLLREADELPAEVVEPEPPSASDALETAPNDAEEQHKKPAPRHRRDARKTACASAGAGLKGAPPASQKATKANAKKRPASAAKKKPAAPSRPKRSPGRSADRRRR